MHLPLTCLLSILVIVAPASQVLALPSLPIQTGLQGRQCRSKDETVVENYNYMARPQGGSPWSNHRNRPGPKGSEGDTTVQVEAEPSVYTGGTTIRIGSTAMDPPPQSDEEDTQQVTGTRTSVRTVVITQQAESSSAYPPPSPEPTTAQTQTNGGVSDGGRKGKISSQDPKQLLTLHNDYRAARGKPALEWDDAQAEYGANYALDCISGHSGGRYGENLASGSGAKADGLFAMWTNEEKDYDPNNPQYSHYTQVVWKSTTKVGCALIDCPAGTLFGAEYGISTYLICEYDTGNVIGQFAENV